MAQPLTRDRPIAKGRAALLIIDVQNGTFGPAQAKSKPEFHTLASTRVIPNISRLIEAFRGGGLEVIYTVIENLTLDGRDRSLDYKLSDFNFAKGSWESRIVAEIAPQGDEIVLPKTSSNVFMSTNIDYLLRNLGVKQLVISGLITDQCVESAVRDACDLGYLVTEVTDACLTYSQERHDNSLRAIKGYCRQRTTDQVIAELA